VQAEYARVISGKHSEEEVLSARPVVPEHVVYREFVNETVVLNLKTGTYHGLNASGGKMLETLRSAVSVRDAAVSLADHYGRPLPEIEHDLHEFCLRLREHGLVELEHE
jgi:Coenzyme PQQ synthesis protein D (PqqD)